MIFKTSLLLFALFSPSLGASPTAESHGATYIGANYNGTDVWKGISYAQPPVGSLRLMPPQPLDPLPTGNIEALTMPHSCYNSANRESENRLNPQQNATYNKLVAEKNAAPASLASASPPSQAGTSTPSEVSENSI